jgi:molybdopterin converting factor small subunit
MFAAAREAAGRAHDEFSLAEATTVGALLGVAGERYGPEFVAVLRSARVWVNGDDPCSGEATRLREGDEVAVLPPVSGGC